MPTALITGASKGIGRSIALRLADDGYDLVIHHRSSEEEANDVARAGVSLAVKTLVVQADLTSVDASTILVEAALDRFDTIDVLINSASMFEADGWEDATMQNIQSHMIVNVFAPLALTRAVANAAEKVDADPGSISVVHSLDQKLTNPNPDYISYTMSKQALEVKTRMLKNEPPLCTLYVFENAKN